MYDLLMKIGAAGGAVANDAQLSNPEKVSEKIKYCI